MFQINITFQDNAMTIDLRDSAQFSEKRIQLSERN
jgi:hypothetical protein